MLLSVTFTVNHCSGKSNHLTSKASAILQQINPIIPEARRTMTRMPISPWSLPGNVAVLMVSLLFVTHSLPSSLFCQALTSSIGHVRQHATSTGHTTLTSRNNQRRKRLLFSTPPSEEEDSTSNASMKASVPAVPPTPTIASREAPEASSSYPIDLPSPLLLASSMILAIVGVGKIVAAIFSYCCYSAAA